MAVFSNWSFLFSICCLISLAHTWSQNGFKSAQPKLRRSLNNSEFAVVSEIATGKIENAARLFVPNANDSTLLQTIVTMTFDRYGKLRQLDNIVAYIDQLPDCGTFEVAYNALLAAMAASDRLATTKVVLIGGQMKRCPNNVYVGEKELDAQVERVLAGWAADVRRRTGHYIAQLSHQPLWYYGFEAYLPRLIEKAYAQDQANSDNVMHFIADLPYLQYYGIAYPVLVEQMQTYGNYDNYLQRIAYRIFTLLRDNPHGDERFQQSLARLRDSFPPTVMRLIWHGSQCTIRPEGDSQKYLVLNNSRKVTLGVSPQRWWSFETHNGDEFYIRNVHFGVYLHQDMNGVFTKPYKEATTQWKVSPSFGRYFTLKNLHSNRNLGTEDVSPTVVEFANVKSGRGGDNMPVVSRDIWTIEC